MRLFVPGEIDTDQSSHDNNFKDGSSLDAGSASQLQKTNLPVTQDEGRRGVADDETEVEKGGMSKANNCQKFRPVGGQHTDLLFLRFAVLRTTRRARLQ